MTEDRVRKNERDEVIETERENVRERDSSARELFEKASLDPNQVKLHISFSLSF